MSVRRALVVHTRMPAFDRDSGSQDVDNTIQFLLRAGWQVTFLTRERPAVAEERHAERLRSMGVAAYAGFGGATQLLRSNDFDLALIAFWKPATELLPLVRDISPRTRIVVNSMDLHFLRYARRSFSQHQALGSSFGDQAAQELSTYNAADAVIAVSDKERDLLADFLGGRPVFTLPLADQVDRSPVPLEQRQGMCFVGNFRHDPNREAVEFLCADVLPILDQELLDRHPLTVIGDRLAEAKLDIDPTLPGIRLVGWVPSVQPYVERSRLAVVPLLHGAGVKRKVLQSMMAGTPVVTTPVGAEGLDLVHGVHALIATDAADLAAGITRLLTDDLVWRQIMEAGAAHVEARHSLDHVEQRFGEIIEQVMARAPLPAREREGAPRFPGGDDHTPVEAIRQRMKKIGRPGVPMLVVTAGDEAFLDLGTNPCWPFPRDPSGEWAGYEPADGPSAINHLEAQRAKGGQYFVLPKSAFGWRARFPELFRHLDATYERVHQDDRSAIWDLTASPPGRMHLAPVTGARVRVVGTFPAHRSGPSPVLLRELGSSTHLRVDQAWRPDSDPEASTAATEADYVVYLTDDALVPPAFLDTLIATQAALDVDRLQPTHLDGPTGGPPITERQEGTIARQLGEVTPLPVLSVRAGSDRGGPVVLADNIAVGLRRALPASNDTPQLVQRVWVTDPSGAPASFTRPEPQGEPRISVLIATHERPELLRACLASFAKQTLDRSEYEVVVIDDGSSTGDLHPLLEEFTTEMQVVGLRIEHAGRSAAKNQAVLLARGPIVLFFDDDDRATPDYLECHLNGHAARPEQGVAILGHTDWAPELERTALMHYVTAVDRLLFAYHRLVDGQELDWRGFWEGRISCKRSLLLDHGLHDQRLDYSIDIEMAWRLAPSGLRVIYHSAAHSHMARPLDFDGFCDRTEAKGRAHAAIAALHPSTEIAAHLQIDRALQLWAKDHGREANLRRRVAELEARSKTDDRVLPDLHVAYREAFRLLHAKGVAAGSAMRPATRVTSPPPQLDDRRDPALVHDGTPADGVADPLLSITIPVWSRTPELARMALSTVERIWEVSKVPTEVVVIDNGSPYEIPLPARVYRFDQNRGVSVGWNAGIRLCKAPMVVVLNSDCRVEPGWDTALFEAVSDGRRIAFPHTDHCDGRGFTRPDQGATAGWCFMFSRALYDELGPFDEGFSPAFCEDTDYWHRAWEAGVELAPVPAARVVHARRTSSEGDDHAALLQAHRIKYGLKHGVDPLRAPPFYKREIHDYVGTFRTPDAAHRPDRPRVFGLGFNKTGTTTLHEALQLLGYESLHWGGPALRQLVEASLADGHPLLSRLDQRFDAFSDIQVLSTSFELLDRQYPGSRFILTIRSVDDWIESRRRHVEANQLRRSTGEYAGRFVVVDESAWRAEWADHLQRVRTYFADRDDLLEIDLTTGARWEALCAFLGVPVPEVPFPWANRGSLRDEKV